MSGPQLRFGVREEARVDAISSWLSDSGEQMVKCSEKRITQDAMAKAMGLYREPCAYGHMAFDHGGITALKQMGGRPARKHDAGPGEGFVGAVCQGRWDQRNGEHPASTKPPESGSRCAGKGERSIKRPGSLTERGAALVPDLITPSSSESIKDSRPQRSAGLR